MEEMKEKVKTLGIEDSVKFLGQRNDINELYQVFDVFCLYITIEVLFRGYSYPLMGVCAGLVVVVLDKINDHISWDIDILLQCMIGMSMITVPFMLLWIVLSFLAIIVADSINYYVFDEKPAPYYKLFGRTIIQFKEK